MNRRILQKTKPRSNLKIIHEDMKPLKLLYTNLIEVIQQKIFFTDEDQKDIILQRIRIIANTETMNPSRSYHNRIEYEIYLHCVRYMAADITKAKHWNEVLVILHEIKQFVKRLNTNKLRKDPITYNL